MLIVLNHLYSDADKQRINVNNPVELYFSSSMFSRLYCVIFRHNSATPFPFSPVDHGKSVKETTAGKDKHRRKQKPSSFQEIFLANVLFV
ncbi:hypothetical protein L2E82_12120 [Cichorium intybus]|uniref:Uncharacterized protein n=1 Tax=Cichorium intybus TaxID=13427 RepID=A0ACB9GGB0_CICIN|nr:hypothetical protein L2E82_12120 [Cichorium intybus]